MQKAPTPYQVRKCRKSGRHSANYFKTEMVSTSTGMRKVEWFKCEECGQVLGKFWDNNASYTR